MPLEIQIDNDFAAIAPASERIRQYLENADAPAAAMFLADLVIEELVTNTIKYGYDDEHAHCVHVTAAFEDGVLTVEVRDDGHEFDPLSRETPDTTLPAEERDIGGLGIHLVCQMADEIRYERAGGWNVVIATKAFPKEPGA
jgi:Anti-sigma regulatory factor (Ser/Thr protein kinase)